MAGDDQDQDGGDPPENTGDLASAVEGFLDEFETVCGEYDRGYVDADAALERVRAAVSDLEAALDDEE